jgi:hypothetical protein
MKKAIVSIVMMLICILAVSATKYHIGDTLNFETSIIPICIGGCVPDETNLQWVNGEGSARQQMTDTCIPIVNESECEAAELGYEVFNICNWIGTELTCDTDLSDNEGLFIYGGYALKGPDNEIITQVSPDDQCNNLPYAASTSYLANKVGTYKFCSVMYALEVSYVDLTCSSNVLDCQMQECQEITVEEECIEDDADIYSDFAAWLGSW